MKTKITAALLLFAAALTLPVLAQEKAKSKLPVFGMGLNIEQLRVIENDFAVNLYPANNFIITINATDHFRIEPEIGFFSFTDKANLPGQVDLTSSGTQVGAGFYYMFQKENVNIFIGAKVISLNYSSDRWYSNYPYTQPVKITDKNTSLSFGPSVGGEYFLGKHFSFGGNLAIMVSSYENKSGTPGSTATESSLTSTVAGLQVRFYF